LHHLKSRKLRVLRCSELSQLHQQPIDAVNWLSVFGAVPARHSRGPPFP